MTWTEILQYIPPTNVLINQMEKYEAEIPFSATIVKINRYYTLT